MDTSNDSTTLIACLLNYWSPTLYNSTQTHKLHNKIYYKGIYLSNEVRVAAWTLWDKKGARQYGKYANKIITAMYSYHKMPLQEPF